MQSSDSSPLILVGVVVAFALLIGAVWASGVSVATGLALTGGILLIGIAVVAMVNPVRDRARADDQRDRMKQTTP
jgi:hypothetical protein